MRCIGAAEKSLELAIQRGLARTAFRKPLIDLGGNRERIAECRVAIDQARLLTLQAAWKIDTLGVMSVVGLMGLPVILVYQGWTYWVFRKRLRVEHIPAAHDATDLAKLPNKVAAE